MILELFQKVAESQGLKFINGFNEKAMVAGLSKLDHSDFALVLNTNYEEDGELDLIGYDISELVAKLNFWVAGKIDPDKGTQEDESKLRALLRRQCVKVLFQVWRSTIALSERSKYNPGKFKTMPAQFVPPSQHYIVGLSFSFAYDPSLDYCDLLNCPPVKVKFDC